MRDGAVKTIRWLAAGLLLLGALLASQSGWGHPRLFAMISYCGYAISAACLGVAVVLLMRSFPHSSEPPANTGITSGQS